MEELLPLLAVTIPLAGAIAAIGVLAFWIDRAGRRSLVRIVEETLSQSTTDPSPPVNLSFCAYRSCIIFWSESEYRMSLPYDRR